MNAHTIQLFAAVHLLIMGLSHVFRHKVWAEFFTWLSKYGTTGVYIHGFISIGFGSIIVAGHNVWTGPGTALTVTGWFYVLKSLHSFLLPEIGVRTLSQVKTRSSRVFIVPGLLMTAIGVLSLYCSKFTP